MTFYTFPFENKRRKARFFLPDGVWLFPLGATLGVSMDSILRRLGIDSVLGMRERAVVDAYGAAGGCRMSSAGASGMAKMFGAELRDHEPRAASAFGGGCSMPSDRVSGARKMSGAELRDHAPRGASGGASSVGVNDPNGASASPSSNTGANLNGCRGRDSSESDAALDRRESLRERALLAIVPCVDGLRTRAGDSLADVDDDGKLGANGLTGLSAYGLPGTTLPPP